MDLTKLDAKKRTRIINALVGTLADIEIAENDKLAFSQKMIDDYEVRVDTKLWLKGLVENFEAGEYRKTNQITI